MTAIAPMVAPAGVVPAGALALDERLALRRIAATADVFDAGGGTWLLAPAPPQLVDTLAALGAADEDREPDDEPELDDPPEDDDPREPTGDREYSEPGEN